MRGLGSCQTVEREFCCGRLDRALQTYGDLVGKKRKGHSEQLYTTVEMDLL